jgi:hypothetical protein
MEPGDLDVGAKLAANAVIGVDISPATGSQALQWGRR